MAMNQVYAASWRIAADLVRAHPQLVVLETHPADGNYDCLSLFRERSHFGDRIHVDINRGGGIHIHAGAHPLGPIRGIDGWVAQAMEHGGSHRVAGQVAEAAGLSWPVAAPPTAPRGLMYGVIARLLAARMLDDPQWDVRCQFYDAGTFENGIAEVVPSPEMAAIPARRFWRVIRGDKTVAWLWDGWVWTRGGERRDLLAAYSRGANLDELVGIVTASPGKRRARPLPQLSAVPEQPTGWENG